MPTKEEILTQAFQQLGTEPSDPTFTIPNPILVHHANYTFGFDNKKKLLDIVKERVEAR